MNVGKRLQVVRRQRGLSQRELASRAGLTNGTISLIEKNKTSPSIASLKRLLDAIPMSMAEFFAEAEDEGPPKFFFRASEFTELSPKESGLDTHGLSLRQLGNASKGMLQVLYETYAPGGDTGPELITHKGEEAGVVVRGEIEITVEGHTERLRAGDGYHFESRLPHRFRNPGSEECVIVSACTPPTF